MTVLASVKNKEIKIEDYLKWELEEDKISISNFFYHRLHSRYLKPFEYKSKLYAIDYKNGFSIMANCCLLIETFISFQKLELVDTKYKSRECFGIFFTEYNSFSEFAQDAFNEKGKLKTRDEGGGPNDFYDNVRCGILHLGETRNGWKITRKISSPLFDETTKTINATKFSNRLKQVIKDYAEELENADWDSDIWKCFRVKMKAIIDNCSE